jgi:alpha-tubulin suppressor-like RCC1 family protein
VVYGSFKSIKKVIMLSLVISLIGSFGWTGPSSSAADLTVQFGDVFRVEAGTSHSLAIREDGSVWTWGNNEFGQLGHGTKGGFSKTPKQVAGLMDIVDIAGGHNYSMALKADGTVWTWGANDSGQLGNGEMSDMDEMGYTLVDRGQPKPVQVTGLTDVAAIAAGWSHAVVLKNDGTVWSWGNNIMGELGIGSREDQSTPQHVKELSGIKDVVVGWNHSHAIAADGSVWSWGYNDSGVMGDGTYTEYETVNQVSTLVNYQNKLTPVKVVGLSGVVTMTCVSNSACYALKEDASVWFWGTYYDDEAVLIVVEPLEEEVWMSDEFYIKDIFSAASETYLVLDDNSIASTTLAEEVGAVISNHLLGFHQGSTGGWFHALMVDQNGMVWAWGDNAKGQLGDGTTTKRSDPVALQTFVTAELLPVDPDEAEPAAEDDSDAAAPDGEASTGSKKIPVEVNGKPLVFQFGEPVIKNNRSLFPLRDLLIGLGVPNDNEHIIWDGKTNTVTAIHNGITVKLSVGDTQLYVNGKKFAVLDVPAENLGGRVYLPARAIAEAFSYTVTYDPATGTIGMNKDSE